LTGVVNWYFSGLEENMGGWRNRRTDAVLLKGAPQLGDGFGALNPSDDLGKTGKLIAGAEGVLR
jgi:hypothetical protein